MSFDTLIDRRHSDSIKWRAFSEDVIPLWVADMDFASPEPVLAAMRERLAHPIFGYAEEPEELRQVIVNRLYRLYDWTVSPDAIIFLPGVIAGLNLACTAACAPGESVLVQTPVYGGILSAAANGGRCRSVAPLARLPDGRYTVDAQDFEARIDGGTRALILCNPHNPVGRAWTTAELEAVAAACLRHDLLICSDEIHSDLVFPPHRHIPVAALAPEIADRTVTLMAPSKTYNIPGLHCAYAIVTNPEWRCRLAAARAGLVPSPGVMGYVAALAAYREGDAWQAELLTYLRENVTLLADFVERELPGVSMVPPEATYLAWLDCREALGCASPYQFFLERAHVALGEGRGFGDEGDGFVRLNFGCPRSLLLEALNRMRVALAAAR